MKIIVDAGCSIPYGSFYLNGLKDMFGSVQFSRNQFEDHKVLGRNVRFIIKDGTITKKVYISTDDSYVIDEEMYKWCDVYGSVNANFEHYPKSDYSKLVSLVPSFAIRNFNLIDTIRYSLSNFFRTYREIKTWGAWNIQAQQYVCNRKKNIRRYFLNYLKNYLYREPLNAYDKQVNVEDNYVFFLSTLWYNDEWNKNDEGVNLRRANFIRACKTIPQIQFEGGLLGNNDKFSDCLTNKSLPFKEWLIKTKKSVVVFNTPAFWNCHGWKLGEYLCLGKAIVSTRLSNDLPMPLIHGENIHFVDDNETSMKEAVEFIVNHTEYRKKLEHGARKYWEEYGTPEKSLELLGIKVSG